MSITLELSPELEARLRADAATRHVPIETLATQAVEAFVSPLTPPKGSRRAAIQAARGSLRGVVSSDEFLAEKHAEAERERAKDEAINWNGNKS